MIKTSQIPTHEQTSATKSAKVVRPAEDTQTRSSSMLNQIRLGLRWPRGPILPRLFRIYYDPLYSRRRSLILPSSSIIFERGFFKQHLGNLVLVKPVQWRKVWTCVSFYFWQNLQVAPSSLLGLRYTYAYLVYNDRLINLFITTF